MDTLEKIEAVVEPGDGIDEQVVIAITDTAEDKLVDAVRSTLAYLVEDGAYDSSAAAVDLIEAQLAVFEAKSPLTDNLRPWQLLASDLAVVLEDLDTGLSTRARAVADHFRSIISMMERNPADELALRNSSRLVLSVLLDLGGRAPAEAVRQLSGHSGSHLSNILKALRGHGLIKEETDLSDKRRKVLLLTETGRSHMKEAVGSPMPDKPADTHFEEGIHIRKVSMRGPTTYSSRIEKTAERRAANVG